MLQHDPDVAQSGDQSANLWKTLLYSGSDAEDGGLFAYQSARLWKTLLRWIGWPAASGSLGALARSHKL